LIALFSLLLPVGAARAAGGPARRSAATSRSLSSRREPTGMSGSEIGPMAMRRSFCTGWPMRWNISRIWRVRPSPSSTDHQEEVSPSGSRRGLRRPPGPPTARRAAAARAALDLDDLDDLGRAAMRQGAVRLPSSTMPERNLSICSSAGRPLTFTS
jgi:hypothetical protein